jgi:hypothetical protein
MTRDRANIGYLMYLADAFCYLGYVAVMLGKGVLPVRGDFLAFFTFVCWVTAAGAAGMLLVAWWYFAVRGHGDLQESPSSEATAALSTATLSVEESG